MTWVLQGSAAPLEANLTDCWSLTGVTNPLFFQLKLSGHTPSSHAPLNAPMFCLRHRGPGDRICLLPVNPADDDDDEPLGKRDVYIAFSSARVRCVNSLIPTAAFGASSRFSFASLCRFCPNICSRRRRSEGLDAADSIARSAGDSRAAPVPLPAPEDRALLRAAVFEAM